MQNILKLTIYVTDANLKLRCNKYFAELLATIHAHIAGNKAACSFLANIIMKAFAINNNDKEKALGCLRRKEKHSN